MDLLLKVTPPDGQAFECTVSDEGVVVGRSGKAGLAVADASLSREHARLFREGGGWFVLDLNSHNGTLLNGQRVERGGPLRGGDKIELGGTLLRVLAESDGGGPRELQGDSSFGPASMIVPATQLIQSTERPVGLKDSESLRRLADRLSVLNGVHRDLGRAVSLDDLLERILDRVFDILQPDEGAVFLLEPSGEARQAAGRSTSASAPGARFSNTLANEVMGKRQSVLVQDVQSDSRFQAAQSMLAGGAKSLIAAPLMDGEEALGMILLSSRAGVQFSPDDAALLTSLASVAALRVRNVGLAREAEERRRLLREVEQARAIQTALLPECLPEIEGYELFAANVPSLGVSGDLYQAVACGGEKRCALLLADVSGKGLSASLLMASLEALCASPIGEGRRPDQVFAQVSELLGRRCPLGKYATAFLAYLDGTRGVLSFANAGHPPALLVRSSGGAERLGATGPPLGLPIRATYTMGETSIRAGDVMVAYSDGLTEATDAGGEEFGIERMEELVVAGREGTASQIAGELQAELDRFTGGAPPSDDRTLLVVKRTSRKLGQGAVS